MKVELGQKVKCRITGFEGIAEAQCDYLNGVRRWEVQPPLDKDGKPVESCMFDEPQLEITDSNKVYECEPADCKVKMGQKVRDTVSDIEGIVVGSALYINGCHRILVVPKKDKDGKYVKGLWIDEPQLEIIEIEKVVNEGSKRTGGPAPMPNRDY